MSEPARTVEDDALRQAGRSAAVALEDVTITFRLAGGAIYTAVERATLAVADGEFVAIVGPTGCGKSTLLNVAAGLLAPSDGSVSIFDAAITACVRLSTPSLVRIAETCAFTVASETESS